MKYIIDTRSHFNDDLCLSKTTELLMPLIKQFGPNALNDAHICIHRDDIEKSNPVVKKYSEEEGLSLIVSYVGIYPHNGNIVIHLQPTDPTSYVLHSNKFHNKKAE